ncbi:P-loop containing nucleoside triphosphate hydrolase protein [Xylariales sp. AK1849]|nr:P-loop containing nucleoside triphosphate hydrolase protein [Xylariales sp. AK1849]
MDTENSINRPSGLRPPSAVSRLPQFSSSSSTTAPGLHEISDSQSNTRAQPSAMAPPPPKGLKRGPQSLGTTNTQDDVFGSAYSHKMIAVAQPEPKRMTMAERAGTEFPGSKSGIVAPTASRNMMKGTSLRDMTSTRPPISGTRQPTYGANGSRNTSNSSYASSLGPGSRPPSRSSHARSASVRSAAPKNGRPVTSMGVRAEEQSNNGTMPPMLRAAQSSSYSTAVPVKKARKYHSVNDMAAAYAQPLSTAREASFCEAFESLSIKGTNATVSRNQRNQAILIPDTPTPSYVVLPNITMRNRGHEVGDKLGIPNKERTWDGPVAPKTPTLKEMQQQAARVDSSYRAESNVTGFIAWDVDERLGNFESEFKAMKDMINNSITGQKSLEEDVAAVRSKASELEQLRDDLESKKSELQSDLDNAERRIFALARDLEDEKRARRNDAEDLLRDHRNDTDNRLRDFNRERDDLERLARKRLELVKEELANDFAKQLGEAHKAFGDLERLLEEEKQNAVVRGEANGKDLEAQLVQLEDTRRELARMRRAQDDLNGVLALKEARILDLEKQVMAGHTALIHLKGDEQKQLDNFRLMREEKQAALDQAEESLRQAQEAKAKLRVEETRRRKLFEQLQTLKGNIRVMCRIRPGRNDTGNAQMETEIGDYDDHIGKMTLMVPNKNYLGEEYLDPRAYDFERVFERHEGNKVVFEEISQLVQSALDGQKVCIFCYGQTGSGKTYTMSSGEDSIIPCATKMIYEQAEALKDAGWTYKMSGSFTEVYNEKLYDLLGRDGTRNQVELRQDPVSKKFYVDSQPTPLESPEEVVSMLETASKNRTVASTKMNRESSRSHSVFTLKLEGVDVDGNTSEGVLNLIDLAGSERVKDSQVEGLNFKEATSINTSLTTLSTVMMALAENNNHIPYRNSSLTKLLEGCLGGNCKTLMFVMISPLSADLKETISSLDFATTVSKAKPGHHGGALKAVKTGRSAGAKKR